MSLLTFEMEVRNKESHPEVVAGFEQEEQPLEIWEVSNDPRSPVTNILLGRGGL